MDGGVTVDLARGRLQDPAFQSFGQPEHIDGAVNGRLRGLHRVVLILNGRSWAGEVVNFVDLDKQREGDIVPQELKSRV